MRSSTTATQRNHPFLPDHGTFLEKDSQSLGEFDDMLGLGIVQPSSSSWTSPLHKVPEILASGDLVVTIKH